MTTLLLPSGLSIRTLISPSSTWIERTWARAMPSTSQIRANACSSAGASSPAANKWALTLSMVPWWVVAQRRRRGVRKARGQLRRAGCSRRRRCKGLDRFPSPLYEAPRVRATRAVRPLSLIGLSPIRPLAVVYPARNEIIGKDHCTFRAVHRGCWGAAAIGALQPKAPVNFRARANWSAKRRN